MPLFGGKDPAEEQAAQTLVNWANSVPPADLATDLMVAFGPDGPKGGNRLGTGDLIKWLFRQYPNPDRYAKPSKGYLEQLDRPISEAVQLLEHAELVYVSEVYERNSVAGGDLSHTGNVVVPHARWSVSRLGWTFLANGTAAVRQRIKDRTGH
jgi:hypothetical protein